jgi:hypothetical protein
VYSCASEYSGKGSGDSSSERIYKASTTIVSTIVGVVVAVQIVPSDAKHSDTAMATQL